jgi:DNA-binding transcriptional MerR regulator
MRNLQRPVDLARQHGLSTQAIRNYEAAGILPSAGRTDSGYRIYSPRHAQALRAFLALVPAHGHRAATAIMQSVNQDALPAALQLIDESHAQLLEDRRTLQAVAAALSNIIDVPSGATATFIGPLSKRLGLRPATLRKWERAGLLTPARDPHTGYRIYTPATIRDAHLTHQLRRGGYPLAQIALVLTQIRTAGSPTALASTLDDWQARLTARSRAMLTAATALDDYLTALPVDKVGP